MDELVDPVGELSRERAERAAAQRARGRLAMLAEASRILSAGETEPARSLAGVAAAARRSVCDACVVEVDGAGGAIRVVVADEPEPELRVALERLTEPVHATGMAFLAPDTETQVAENLSLETMKAFRKYGYRSVLAVPVLRSGRVSGTLAWLARTPQRFGAADVVVAEDLAGRIGVALESHSRRHSLEGAVRERDARLEALGRELRTGLPGLVLDLEALAASPPADLHEELVRIASGAAQLSSRVLDLVDGGSEAAPEAAGSEPVAQKSARPS